MKKIWAIVAAVFLLTATAVGATGCDEREQTDGQKGGKPIVFVSQSALYCDLGESVTLPAATATDERDGDLTDRIKVAVFAGETVAMSEHGGDVPNEFVPESAGNYTARYSVVNSSGISSDVKEVNISVGEMPAYGTGIPVITVETEDAVFSSGNITLRAATGKAADGSELSSSVRVNLYDWKNVSVFEGAGNEQQSVNDLTDGTYTAVYTLSHEGKVASEQSYTVTVASGGDVRPFLSAPVQSVTVFCGETVPISAANASDLIDGDLSDRVEYRIETADGKQVKGNASAAESSQYVFEEAGEYKVIYSVQSKRGVAAEERGFSVIVQEKRAGEIILDGITDEEEYLAVPSYRFGLGGNVIYRFYAADDALYIGAVVSDYSLIGSNAADAETKLNLSDGLEFYFDPGDTGRIQINNTQCFRIRVGIDGTTKSYIAATNDQWSAGSFDLSEKVKVKLNGTVSVNKVTAVDASNATDEDAGYSVELKLPWSFFGYSAKPSEDASYGKDYIRIGFGHRDVKSTQVRSDFYQINSENAYLGANNAFYNGTNTTARPKVATEGLNPSLYSELYLSGSSLGVNPVSWGEDVVLDGFMENSFWSDAQEIPFGDTQKGAAVTAKIRLTQEGVYAAVWIEDGQIISDARSFLNNYGMVCNDNIDLRITVGEERTRSSLIQPTDKAVTDSKVLAIDASGAAYMQMLQPVGAARTHKQLPFAYGVTADGTVGRCARNDQWSSSNLFVADKDVGDADNGWGVEVFLPWSTLNTERPGAGASVTVGVMLAIFDRDADPTGTAWKYGYISDDQTARITPNAPNTYYMVTQTV